MSDFFSPQDLTFEQVKAITHGMMAVARVDGVHDYEMRMIREFYEGCARKGDPRLEEVVKGEFSPEAVKGLFNDDQLKMLVKTLILLAFADGQYALEEDKLVRKYAGVWGMNDAQVDALHEATKDYLLASLVHIKNTDALKEVARRLNPH